MAKTTNEPKIQQQRERLLSPNTVGLSIPVSKQEWAYAKQHCSEGGKLDKRQHSAIKHSFCMVNGELYAFDVGKENYLGEGSFGRVKKCQSEDGSIFAVKVEGVGNHQENIAETRMMDGLGRMKGVAKRKLDKAKSIAQQEKTTARRYLVQEIIPGRELTQPQTSGSNKVEKKDRILLARAAAIKLGELHQLGYVHRDVKMGNFIYNPSGLFQQIEAVDFGLSCRQGGALEFAGNPAHVPPESFINRHEKALQKGLNPEQRKMLARDREQRFGNITLGDVEQAFQSMNGNFIADASQDSYALGIMLRRDFFLDTPEIQAMLSVIPGDRPNMAETALSLEAAFCNKIGLEPEHGSQYFKLYDQMEVIFNHLRTNENWKALEQDSLDMFFLVYDGLNADRISKEDLIEIQDNFDQLLQVEFELDIVLKSHQAKSAALNSDDSNELSELISKLPDNEKKQTINLIAARPGGPQLCKEIFERSPVQVQKTLYDALCQNTVNNIKEVVPSLPTKKAKGLHFRRHSYTGASEQLINIIKSNEPAATKVDGLNNLLMEMLKNNDPQNEQLKAFLKSELKEVVLFKPVLETPRPNKGGR